MERREAMEGKWRESEASSESRNSPTRVEQLMYSYSGSKKGSGIIKFIGVERSVMERNFIILLHH